MCRGIRSIEMITCNALTIRTVIVILILTRFHSLMSRDQMRPRPFIPQRTLNLFTEHTSHHTSCLDELSQTDRQTSRHAYLCTSKSTTRIHSARSHSQRQRARLPSFPGRVDYPTEQTPMSPSCTYSIHKPTSQGENNRRERIDRLRPAPSFYPGDYESFFLVCWIAVLAMILIFPSEGKEPKIQDQDS